jgi:RNA polymerase-associated protein LEO1
VNRKYAPTDRRRQLSPGFLEDALDEDDEADYYDSRRTQRHFKDDLEAEARAEKRIMNAKKSQGPKGIPRKSSFPPAKSSRHPMGYSDDEREESEYETEDDEEEERPLKRDEDSEPEYEDDEEDYEETAQANDASEEEEGEELKPKSNKSKGKGKSRGFESDEDSPPRKKPTTHRRMTVVSDCDDE